MFVSFQNRSGKRRHMFNRHLVGTFWARAVGAQSDLGKIQCHHVWEAPDTMSANVVGHLA